MVDELEGEDGGGGMGAWPRDRGSGHSSAHPSDFSVILHSPSALPTASLNHFLKPKIKTQLQLSQRKRRRKKTTISLYIAQEMKGRGHPKAKGIIANVLSKIQGGETWRVGESRNAEGTKRLDKQKR